MFAFRKYIMRREPYTISRKRYIIFREGSNRAVFAANCNLAVNGCKARVRVGVTVTPLRSPSAPPAAMCRTQSENRTTANRKFYFPTGCSRSRHLASPAARCRTQSENRTNANRKFYFPTGCSRSRHLAPPKQYQANTYFFKGGFALKVLI